MAETTLFELVSPERLLVSEPVGMVVMPGSEGDFAAMPRHAPMIATLRPGVIDVYDGGKIAERIFVAGGFAEVTEERCTVLAEEAMPVADIDPAAIAQQIADLRDELKDTTDAFGRGRIEARIATLDAMAAAKARAA
jgi:F-type H+-transporting ATPase subunit epsilon